MTFAQQTVGDIVAEDYRRGAIFKQFGIDFCCGGGITVEKACRKKGVDIDELEEAIRNAGRRQNGAAGEDARSWSPDFLADYIVNVHHTYVRQNLPILLQFSQKVARVHGGGRPELIQVAQLTAGLADEMQAHLEAEEEELFPFVKALVAARKTDGEAPKATQFVEESLSQREAEHEHAGAVMAQIRELTSDFTPPEGACNTYRALFAKLEEFEQDLHRHVHLENNVLFPRARKLKEQLTS